MAIISHYVTGPYQGVSQAPPQVQLDGQCKVQENCIAAIPNGLQKRPPFVFHPRALLPSLASSDMLVADIPRGSLADDLLLVINPQGAANVPYLFKGPNYVPVIVDIDNDAVQNYLNSSAAKPGQDLFTTTIEDVTFVVNKRAMAIEGFDTEPTRNPEALIYIKSGAYGRNYIISVTPAGGTTVSATYLTGDGSTPSDAMTASTEAIADGLATGTIPSGASFSGDPLADLVSQGFTVGRNGPVIYLRSDSGADFVVSASDGQGGSAMTVVKGAIQRFSDLPAQGIDGFVVKIEQSAAGPLDDYWVQFEARSSDNLGVWNEVRAPGANTGVAGATMPIIITYDPTTNTALFALGPWVGRTTGNSQVNPAPPYINDFIQRVGWWRGRLALTYNGGVLLSSSDNPFKTYRSTLTTILDSDPISLLNPADRKAFFKDGYGLNQRFILLADKVQAAVSSTGALTPGATRIDQIGSTEYTPQTPALAASKRLYYASLRTTSTIVYELAIDRISGELKAEDLTPAVPTYLPSTLDRAALQESDYFHVYGSSGTNTLYLHLVRYAEEERVQNAWSRWTLPDSITLGGMFFKGSLLKSVLIVGGAAFVASLDVTPQITDVGSTKGVLTHLDGRLSLSALSATYDPSTSSTTVIMPYAMDLGEQIRVTIGPGSTEYPEGFLIGDFTPVDAHTLVIAGAGDLRSEPAFLGYRYRSSYVPSRHFKLGQDDRPELTGRLSLKRYKVDLARTSNLEASVRIKGRQPQAYAFSPYSPGDEETPMDQVARPETSQWTIPLGGQNTQTEVEFFNNSHLGFKLAGFEWWASWNPKAQRA